MLKLYSLEEISRELGLTYRQVCYRIATCAIPTMREKRTGRGAPRILVPLEPFLTPFPTRKRKAR